MFNHILVPVDGSPTAHQAIAKALAMAQAFGSAVTLIYVIDPYAFAGMGTDLASGQAHYLAAASAEADAALDQAGQAFEAHAHLPVLVVCD